MILVNGRWKIRNPKTNRLVLTTSKLAKDIIREISPPIPNDCLEIIARMVPLDVIKVSKFFRDSVLQSQQLTNAKIYGKYLLRYLTSGIDYYIHRKLTLYGYDGHQLSIEIKDTSDYVRTFTITSTYDKKIYTFKRNKRFVTINAFSLRASLPITFVRKINHILNNLKNFSSTTYFRINKNKCYNKWMRLGRPAGAFDLFDIYTFSQLPSLSNKRIYEPVVIKEWTEKIHEFNRV